MEVEVEANSNESRKKNKIIIPPLKGLGDLSNQRSLNEFNGVTFRSKDSAIYARGSKTERGDVTVKNNTYREDNMLKEYNIVRKLKKLKSDR